MRKLASMGSTILFVISLATLTFGQGNGSLTGTVTDQTGAVVSGAHVSATNVATSVSYDTETTDAGLYRFPTLRVSTYTVAGRERIQVG